MTQHSFNGESLEITKTVPLTISIYPRFACTSCPMKFLSKEEEEKHLLDAHGVVKGLLLDCGQCQQQFAETTKFRKTIKDIAFIICLSKKYIQHQIMLT